MALLLDDLLLAPVKLPVWVARRLRQMAMEELTDEAKVQEELLENQMRLELGDITEEQYTDQETKLMQRLDEIRRLNKVNDQRNSREKTRWQRKRQQPRR